MNRCDYTNEDVDCCEDGCYLLERFGKKAVTTNTDSKRYGWRWQYECASQKTA